IQSLEKISLGVIADYLYGDEFDEYVKKYKDDDKRVQVVFGDGALSSNIKKVMIGRIDSFVEDMMVCNSELKNMKKSGDVVPAGQLVESNVYIAFSPNLETSEAYAKILTEGMIKLRKTGQLKEILDKYGLSDWK
ncbi:MAG: transporter substrate-binding domain-containing protein, partial [SAR324 cluster bacterium]|nr:transporter substrate-binding domain-containing protein [SAR324 cluster bacterium]